jgi:translation initiation factor IF-3
MDKGKELISRIKEATLEFSMVESEPKLEGRRMMMQLAPAKGSK